MLELIMLLSALRHNYVDLALMGTLLVFANERNYLMQQAPSVYYGLVRMFFPY